ncbi:hypothetical protein KKC60_03600, partial [Patescibacteria group bacterium]|nr:hypothetical protein [Patescibacteria group bacterium]
KLLGNSVTELNEDTAKNWQESKPKNTPQKVPVKNFVEIAVPRKASKDFFLSLKEKLAQSPGDKKVFLKVTTAEGDIKRLETSLQIDPQPELIIELERLVGENNIK